MDKFARVLHKILDKILAFAMICIMTSLVAAVSWQVFSRYVLSAPSTSTDELARFMLIWLVMLGSAYCVGKKAHLSIDLFQMGDSSKLINLQGYATDILVLGFASTVLILGGFRLLKSITMSQGISPAMQLPLEYIFMILPITGVLISLYVLSSLIERFVGSTTVPPVAKES